MDWHFALVANRVAAPAETMRLAKEWGARSHRLRFGAPRAER